MPPTSHASFGTPAARRLAAALLIVRRRPLGGHVKPKTVAGQTQGRYHPPPWGGVQVHVSCPTGPKAVTGTTRRRTGQEEDGTVIDIAVTVIKATDSHIT
jgi:hypothetical protein